MHNRFYREVPFLRLFLPFLFGILLGFALNPEKKLLTGFLILILFFIAADQVLKISSGFSREWMYGILLQAALVLSGALTVDLKKSLPDYRDYLNGEDLIIADLTEFPENKPNSYKVIAGVKAVKNHGTWKQTRGKCLIYFRKDTNSERLIPGDRIVFYSRFDEIPFNRNPYEFNYRKYMHRKGVFKQIFLEKEKWVKIGEGSGNFLLLTAVKMQDNLYRKYKEYGLKDDVLEVAGALTLGLREKLGDKIEQSYKTSGAVHILAISGLHVGILYIVLFYSLSFLKRRRWGKVVMVLFILSALWFFALLTGLSPSVLRASTMFSFILIGQSIKRYSNVYNSLAVSAFILLLVNPYLIFNVGFQLSYFAVLGIVIIQPRLHNIMRSKIWLVDKISGLVAVSVAAQLAISPLSLYYFHQFPVYFWLTNIIVIPFATLILYAGLLFFLFSFQPFIAGIIEKALTLLIKGMNISVVTIKEFPFSIINDIHISASESILLYCMVIFTCLFLIRKKGAFFIAMLGVVLIFISFNFYQLYKTLNQKIIVLYNIEGLTAMNFIDGRTSYMIHNADKINMNDQLAYYTENHLNASGIRKKFIFPMNSLIHNKVKLNNGPLYFNNGFIKYYDMHFFVYFNDSHNKSGNSKKVKVDALVYSNPYGMRICNIRKKLLFNNVIISSSIPEWKARIIQKECENDDISCRWVRNEGPIFFEL